MILFVLAAFASSPDRYPWEAPVELPETGVVRIDVGPDLRTRDDPPNASDMMLVNGAGERVPVAVVRGGQAPERIDFRRGGPSSTMELVYWPVDVDTWELTVQDRPIEALSVELPLSPLAATATLSEERGGGWVEVSETLVFNTADGSSPRVSVPARLGHYKLDLDYHGVTPVADPDLVGLRWAGGRVGDETLPLPVSTARLTEADWVRYDVLLPHSYPVRALRLDPAAELFDRQALVQVPQTHSAPDVLPPEPQFWNATPIQRLSLGGAEVDLTEVQVSGRVNDRLVAYISSQGRPPLEMDEVTAVFPDVHLLVQDPGPGPHRLLAGAPPGTTPTTDLQFAVPELARQVTSTAETGPRTENAAYRPPEVRGKLSEPGSALKLSRWKWTRPVDGEGLVRIPLPVEVQGSARPDLADLRLVDPDGRQIPYVLRNQGVLHDWGELPFERDERGETSVLEVPLPEEDVNVGSVTLTTDAPIFDRTVTISRPRAGRLETQRVYQWRGSDRPSALTLDLHRRFGDTLVIEIDNGDDPPLPIESVSAAWPGWELVARVPTDASLIYGNMQADRPDYDLALLRTELHDRSVAAASLGEQERLDPPPLSFTDRILVGFGVGVMGIGLLVLTLLLLRGIPEEEDPEDGEGDEGDAVPPGNEQADSESPAPAVP